MHTQKFRDLKAAVNQTQGEIDVAKSFIASLSGVPAFNLEKAQKVLAMLTERRDKELRLVLEEASPATKALIRQRIGKKAMKDMKEWGALLKTNVTANPDRLQLIHGGKRNGAP